MSLLLVLLLLFPGVAMASDNICSVGSNDCFVVSSASEMEIYKKTPSTVALNSSCNESSECMLSEEQAPQPAEFNSGPLLRNVTFTDISEKAKIER